MDLAYNQHSDRARRKNRSSTNINHLTLAPLTVKLPLTDPDSIADLARGPVTSSYLEGKSAPTTPRFLGHAAATPRSRSQHRYDGELITKSRSSTNLLSTRRPGGSGASTPRRRRAAGAVDDPTTNTLTSRHRNDSDWLLRTGALMSAEARESKGQAWLVSRQSSTSLAGMRGGADDTGDDAFFEQERRRGSTDDASSPAASRRTSRFASRAHSMDHHHGHFRSSSAVLTPMDPAAAAAGDSYFPATDAISGPDFVNLDQKLEELGARNNNNNEDDEDDELDDEAAIRRLMREGKALKGSWIASFIGWSLFEEDGEEDDDEEEDEDDDEKDGARGTQTPRHVQGITTLPSVKLTPPKEGESSWSDAAWLLSLASKVIF
ncbi:hypothetical protein ISF_02731 [Cordyceps fumosorosea ARSEF 2679]|uniref:Uncharacterized protein n=1 Tax=Cordyceps fumosorosea (strain ARSEF 2679) TaxID=1081104 RepID=A0A168B0Y1_CORFA|nr:hypothetical protein ISF_02731 [Cordyceps fumosorosea ARSEF 2679]OAA69461.1 hypothetical protein ISF_02731 [Cordyceps fumosorosea ARSEF 2679]